MKNENKNNEKANRISKFTVQLMSILKPQDEHKTDSEKELNNAINFTNNDDRNDENDKKLRGLKFFIGRNNDIIWANKPFL